MGMGMGTDLSVDIYMDMDMDVGARVHTHAGAWVCIHMHACILALPSVVLYILSHSIIFSSTPGMRRERSAAEWSWAAIGSVASMTMILWSSSP